MHTINWHSCKSCLLANEWCWKCYLHTNSLQLVVYRQQRLGYQKKGDKECWLDENRKCFNHGGDMKPRFRITYCLTSPFHEKRRQPLERVGTGYSGSLWLFNIPRAMIGFEKSDFSLIFKQGFWQCLAVGLSPSKPQATRVLKEKCPQEFSGDSSNGDGARQGHGIQLHIIMCFPKRWSSCAFQRGGPLWAQIQSRPTMVWRSEQMTMVISSLL